MITIQSVMLVALGFLVAALITLLLAPAYRLRSVRLTTEALKRSMPLNEAEIRADKDRLRAEYAIEIHRLETRLEEAGLAAARQMVELNRRDAAISSLEGEQGVLRTALDEHENARRVLEQTIMDRLPKVEYRLAEAKKLLFQRDREIAVLSQSAEKQRRALDEATQINTQQRDEIHRLGATLATRAARNRDGLGDPKFDGEVALRSEIEALRAKTRDQASLIDRLQGLLVRAGVAAEGIAGRNAPGREATSRDGAVVEAEIARLRTDLAEAEAALKTARNSADSGKAVIETELRALKAAHREQAAELARLKAALETYEAGDKDDKAIRESKIALKARLSAAQAQVGEQTATIQSLRAEMAAANERMARQSAHFRDEMRRLGAGTLPVSTEPRRAQQPETPRPSLTERINAPRRARVGEADAKKAAAEATAETGEPARNGVTPPAVEAKAGSSDTTVPVAKTNGDAAPPAASAEPQAEAEAKARRRPRLLERITGLHKSSA